MGDGVKPRGRRGVKTRKDQPAERVKASVLLERGLYVRVGAAAAMAGKGRGEWIAEVLAEATRGIVVSVRGGAPGGGGEGGGSGADDADGR